MNDKCIFCKIIKNEISSHKVYEDDKVLAFLDINPTNPGHILLISKEHYENTIKTPEELLQYMITVVKKIAPAIIKGVGAKAWNLIVNNGADAGQVVFHTHWHIIPRFKDDGHKPFSGEHYKYQEGEIEKIIEKIKENL